VLSLPTIRNAVKQALSRANLHLNDMDLIEVNEAFAAQFLAVQKELELDMEKTVRPPLPCS
jgi:acetyl-CoA acyltransferase 2